MSTAPSTDPSTQPNALVASSSPYLRQHAHNPVSWVGWSPEAFAEARRRDVPVLVSIGYSTCHWCHVMAHESFEDLATATQMNAQFVCIKVDREEHPEVDHIYMDAVQALTGHGGWPLNAFVDHDGRPFYACTYLPKNSWGKLCAHLTNMWRTDRERVMGAAHEITEHLREAPAVAGVFPATIEADLAHQLSRAWDAANPGFAWNQEKAPKFPPNQFVNFALGHPDAVLAMMAEQILEAMQDSGLHDRVGGGFHRYSVDAQWRLPHFEKMLYDNAQLIPAYLRHGREDFRQTAINAGDYLLRDLRLTVVAGDILPEGAAAFATGEDADDPAGEGSFYAWSPAQLDEVLGAQAGTEIAHAWAITNGKREMNAHGHSEPAVSHIPHPRGTGMVTNRAAWEPLLPRLRFARDARPRPGRDDKALTDQNALALEAFAWLGRLTGETRFITASRELANFLRTRVTASGVLRLAHRPAYITDYGALVCGLTAAFDLLGDATLIDLAVAVAEEAIARLKEDNGGFATTPAGRGDLIRRTQEHTDNAWPGGEAQLALGFVRLWNVTGADRWRTYAEGILAAAAETATRAPASSVTMIRAWSHLRHGQLTAVVIGDPAAPATQALLAAVKTHPDPELAIVPLTSCANHDWACLEGRRDLTVPQVLICRGTTCRAPAFTTEDVAQRLRDHR